MRKTVIAIALVIAALTVTCIYLAYSVMDQAVTLDHKDAVRRSLEGQRAALSKLSLDLGKRATRGEIEALLAARYAQGHLVKQEGDTIHVDGVGLRFRGDELVEIVFIN